MNTTLRQHQLADMTLNQARNGLEALSCPEHGEAATSSRTTWDVQTGRDMVRIVFACGCHGLAVIKKGRRAAK